MAGCGQALVPRLHKNNYSDVDGPGTCKRCGAGKHSSSLSAMSADTCLPCEAGKASSTLGATSESTCVPCQVNTFSDSLSAELCTPCTEGTFSLEGSSTCSAATCPAGQEPTSSTECSPCQSNTFSSSNSTDLCSPCPTGKFSGYGAVECLLDKPLSIIVSGMCLSIYDGVYQAKYETASRRWYYENDNGMFIYFDPTCDGSGGNPNLWIVDNSEPSTTAVNDLDGDSTCTFAGYITSTSMTPPTGTNTWKILCDGSWTDVPITITESDTTETPDTILESILIVSFLTILISLPFIVPRVYVMCLRFARRNQFSKGKLIIDGRMTIYRNLSPSGKGIQHTESV
ncbi:hypothetical protein TrST_g266 [Triparma strigata]|uniref:Tyrosine-protein kinase ephrin type A/B receptor-like domain-containing protein n=1 Tax=Triparma strigata TaxID=1606541 RepID=A0A9W7E2M0_9STRA|nr:hypothetical protein TrST_g266 [Triparma strigata]